MSLTSEILNFATAKNGSPKYIESKHFSVQLERLEIGQNILDQPPYNELFPLVPTNFFENYVQHRTFRHGLLRFIKNIGEWHGSESNVLPDDLKTFLYSEKQNKCNFQIWSNLIHPDYRTKWKKELIYEKFRDIDRVLERYPWAYRYINDKKDQFTADGSPKIPNNIGGWYKSEITFAAYQDIQIKADQSSVLIGIANEGPQGYSHIDDIRFPPKGEPNRTFRIVVHSETMG
jgi:hypothetical protein